MTPPMHMMTPPMHTCTRVHDFTETFKSNKLQWNLTNTLKRGNELDNQFSDTVRNVKQGLYLCIFQNPSTQFAVRDNNMRLRNGKVFYKQVIPRRGISAKFGKFEIPHRQLCDYSQSGLISRMKLNYEHLHYYKEDPDDCEKVFTSTLTKLYVLDLTGTSVNVAETSITNTPSAFENLWNMSIEKFINARGYTKDLAQNLRSEWRVVNHDILKATELVKIEAYLHSLASGLLGFCNNS